jgi:hypothetical protein
MTGQRTDEQDPSRGTPDRSEATRGGPSLGRAARSVERGIRHACWTRRAGVQSLTVGTLVTVVAFVTAARGQGDHGNGTLIAVVALAVTTTMHFLWWCWRMGQPRALAADPPRQRRRPDRMLRGR